MAMLRTLGRVALCTHTTTKPTIEIPTFLDIFHSLVRIDLVQLSKKSKGVDSTERETGVNFAEGITRKHTRGLLKRHDN